MESGQIFSANSVRIKVFLFVFSVFVICGGLLYINSIRNKSDGNDVAWIIATKLSTSVSPTIEIKKVTSADNGQVPIIFNALEEVFKEETSQKQRTLPSDRSISISIWEVKSIVDFFEDDFIDDKKTYEYYIEFAEDNYSILILLDKPIPIS